VWFSDMYMLVCIHKCENFSTLSSTPQPELYLKQVEMPFISVARGLDIFFHVQLLKFKKSCTYAAGCLRLVSRIRNINM